MWGERRGMEQEKQLLDPFVEHWLQHPLRTDLSQPLPQQAPCAACVEGTAGVAGTELPVSLSLLWDLSLAGCRELGSGLYLAMGHCPFYRSPSEPFCLA